MPVAAKVPRTKRQSRASWKVAGRRSVGATVDRKFPPEWRGPSGPVVSCGERTLPNLGRRHTRRWECRTCGFVCDEAEGRVPDLRAASGSPQPPSIRIDIFRTFEKPAYNSRHRVAGSSQREVGRRSWRMVNDTTSKPDAFLGLRSALAGGRGMCREQRTGSFEIRQRHRRPDRTGFPSGNRDPLEQLGNVGARVPTRGDLGG